ncbi:MAG: N-acetylmuramoyl-L-alanine amidase [Elusimicrobiota bacterium]
MIDPGHGALNKEGKFDGGAFGPDGTKESWINLEVAKRVKYYLDKHPEIFEVKMTRYTELLTKKLEPSDRANIASDWSDDGNPTDIYDRAHYFISIHHNSYEKKPQGTETFISRYALVGSDNLANRVLGKILNRFGPLKYENRGVKIDYNTRKIDFGVLKGTRFINGELSEASNIKYFQDEVNKFKATDGKHIDNEAWAIYAGLMEFLQYTPQNEPPKETASIKVQTTFNDVAYIIEDTGGLLYKNNIGNYTIDAPIGNYKITFGVKPNYEVTPSQKTLNLSAGSTIIFNSTYTYIGVDDYFLRYDSHIPLHQPQPVIPEFGKNYWNDDIIQIRLPKHSPDEDSWTGFWLQVYEAYSPQKVVFDGMIGATNMPLICNLNPGTSYKAKMRLCKDTLLSDWSRSTDLAVVDITPPVGTIVLNNGNPTNSTTINISITASDTGGSGLSKMFISDDGYEDTWPAEREFATSVSYTLSPSITDTDGDKTISVRLMDAAGNVSEPITSTINLIRLPPSTPPSAECSSAVSINNTLYSNPQLAVKWSSSSDEYSTVDGYRLEVSQNPTNWTQPYLVFSMDVGNVTEYILPESTVLNDNTQYYARISAINGFGLLSTPKYINGITIDKTSPQKPVLTSPQNNAIVGKKPTFDWDDINDTTGVSYELLVDNNIEFSSPQKVIQKELTSSIYTSETELFGGVYYCRVLAKDGVGNRSPWSDIQTFTIDTTPPPVPQLVNPGMSEVLNTKSPIFTWSVVTDLSVPVKYKIQVDNDSNFSSPVIDSGWQEETIYPRTETYNYIPSDGIYYWRVMAKDGIGNESSWSGTQYFEVKTALPTSQPSVPIILYPTDMISTSDLRPLFAWEQSATDSGYAHTHRVQIGAVDETDGRLCTPTIDAKVFMDDFEDSDTSDWVPLGGLWTLWDTPYSAVSQLSFRVMSEQDTVVEPKHRMCLLKGINSTNYDISAKMSPWLWGTPVPIDNANTDIGFVLNVKNSGTFYSVTIKDKLKVHKIVNNIEQSGNWPKVSEYYVDRNLYLPEGENMYEYFGGTPLKVQVKQTQTSVSITCYALDYNEQVEKNKWKKFIEVIDTDNPIFSPGQCGLYSHNYCSAVFDDVLVNDAAISAEILQTGMPGALSVQPLKDIPQGLVYYRFCGVSDTGVESEWTTASPRPHEMVVDIQPPEMVPQCAAVATNSSTVPPLTWPAANDTGRAGVMYYESQVSSTAVFDNLLLLNNTINTSFNNGTAIGWESSESNNWVVVQNNDNNFTYKQTATGEQVSVAINSIGTNFTAGLKLKYENSEFVSSVSNYGVILKINDTNNIRLVLTPSGEKVGILCTLAGMSRVLVEKPLTLEYGIWYDIKLTVVNNIIRGYIKPAESNTWVSVVEAMIPSEILSICSTAKFGVYTNNVSAEFDDITQSPVTIDNCIDVSSICLTEGKYYYRVRAVDAAGNPGEWPPSSEVVIDKTVSSTGLSFVGNTYLKDNIDYLSSNTNILLNATDTLSGISSTSYRLGTNDSPTPCRLAPVTYSKLQYLRVVLGYGRSTVSTVPPYLMSLAITITVLSAGKALRLYWNPHPGVKAWCLTVRMTGL